MRPALVLCALVALAACQPTGGPAATPTPTGAGDGGDRLGAPTQGMPAALEDLRVRGGMLAEEWQDEPVLAEIEITLREGQWAGARLVYLAADADRLLALTTSGGGFSIQRPTLATLQVEPITDTGMAAMPRLSRDAAEPAELAAVAAEADCELGMPTTVLYATGAPVAWDGTTWTSPPEWTVTVTDDEGVGAVVEPVSGDVTACL